MESQHGDEMGGPDTRARHHARAQQPGQAAPRLLIGTGAQHHGARGDTGKKANTCRRGKHAQIMLIINATQDEQHGPTFFGRKPYPWSVN